MEVTAHNLLTGRRIEYIDIFRALGIILMIMGHIGFGGAFDKWIHAFHMPMFFFISGWFYKKKDAPLSSVLSRKVKTLLLPYIVIGSTELVISYMLFSKYSGYQPLLSFIFTNTDGQSPVPGALWFLTALFFTELIYILLDRGVKNRWILHIIVVLISVFGTVAVDFIPFRLPWGIDAGCVGIGLFHIAHIIKGTRVNRVLKLKLWITILLGVVVSISILLSPAVNMRTASYTGYLLFWINALVAIIVGWNLARYLHDILDSRCRRIGDLLANIGKNSIVYLAFNQICIIVTSKIVRMVSLPLIVEKIMILLFVLFLLRIFEKVICNTKLRAIIGM